ncbi:MAG: hypothetical protein KA765_18930 [Thermoflexales bacterium]|nr:hypothetical protein [Thermoflexales bacterium]
MRTPSILAIKKLPQADDQWLFIVHCMRTWIAPPGEKPYRPYLLLVINASGLIVKNDVLERAPTAGEVTHTMLTAMAKPPRIVGKAQRPVSISLADQGLGEALKPVCDELGIALIEYSMTPELRELLAEMESAMSEGEELPGLLSVKGTSPEFIGQLFSAAAEFYRAEPWVKLYNVQLLAVRHPAERSYRFVSVMGNGGVEYGLATYPTWKDVEAMFGAGDDPLAALPASGAHSLLFSNITEVPFDDLDASEQYGWEIASEQLYPVPLIFYRDKEPRRPSLKDLRWYEAALRAIPIFVRDHLKSDGQGDYLPIETAIEINTHDGRLNVMVKYPGGILPPEARPAPGLGWQIPGEDDEDTLPFFDRRGMEGAMRQTAAKELGLDAVGTGDSALDQAQQIMYQAFDESHPGKRLTLAHQALSISADCADAWVLLAEEEADTVQRALDYFQKGVEAGRRALGDQYFQQYVGDFWGLLETRPFMRALEGTASLLWNMSLRAAAAEIYFEMLRLNPNDNQGVRYSLLNLLLEAERADDAQKLLKQYKDDYSSVWIYTRALLEFRTGGAAAKANKSLKAALEQNPFVPAYLTGQKRIPNQLPDYIGMGDENEAIDYSSSHLNHWRRVPGAVDWLKAQIITPKPSGPMSTPHRRGRTR